MILVKKINQQDIVVNCELIEMIEFVPHTVITMTTGEKIIVKDGAESILRKTIEYKRSILNRDPIVIEGLPETPNLETVKD